MSSKTISILAYVTIIGWLIAYFGGKEQRDETNRYHLKQGFGIGMLTFCYGILVQIVGKISATAGTILGYVGFVFLALMVIGALNAYNEQKKPLPVIGKMFEGKFDFI